MRQIKFRVWNGTKWDYFTLGEIRSFYMETVYNEHCLNGRIFYQFTGWHDKDGNEIYEGHKLSDYSGKEYTVVFNDGCFCAQYETTEKQESCNKSTMHHFRITGDIHETQ